MYKLLDFGNGKRLEQFGAYKLIRPDVYADKTPVYDYKKWKVLADAEYVETTRVKGEWTRFGPLEDDWKVTFNLTDVEFSMLLRFNDFKNVGVFPEQKENWQRTLSFIRQNDRPVDTLNLFAYTGAASIVAAKAGSNVTHVDSVKKTVDWAKQSMDLSGVSVRRIVDDAFKFVSREAKRGSRYQHIILDPPAFGRGPKNEIWKLEENLEQLLMNVKRIVDPNNYYIILNAYSSNTGKEWLESIVCRVFPRLKVSGLYLTDESGRRLLTGYVAEIFS